ncbi:carboxypeptidase-like regulatory domain-containing protein [Prolixibacter denitrificans]|uniref:Carboxypeptidase-like protein n=1 Tax=Prolixibacter denitrificans TaxID=1541063 RepID=A0A2P8CH73_9BACT|nr:carboxypeptidase-like regulatory domain-containing protein [Prolixibacter denitrificans]PSK84328.1 carboxypeptidase-like protein [Prolixibacter denitrificans]GET20504.1 hypothetical protein JCM18694_07500 [Prolixibacter denitrificans]
MFKKYGILLWLICLLVPGVRAQEAISVLQRPITISIDSSSVEDIIDQLVLENDLYFSYNPQILPQGLYSCHVEKKPLKSVLRQLLPAADYQIEVIDNQIIIKYIEKAPLRVSAQIIDRDNHEPVPYASVTIDGQSIGTITNSDGRFDLVIPQRLLDHDVLIGCLGYVEYRITPDSLKNVGQIDLKPVSYRLREVRVKPVEPEEIIARFRSHIVDNYTLTPQLMTTFYRETVRQDGKYMGVWEAVMEMLKSPYRGVRSDRVRFIKGRKSEFNRSYKDVKLKIQGGPYYITKLDVVKNLESFLDPQYEQIYRYKFEQPIVYNGRVAWVIRFSRKERVDYPCFNGYFLIDAESYALIMADFSLDNKSLKILGESFIKKQPHNVKTQPIRAEYKITYRELNGKWSFYMARTDVQFRVRNKENHQRSIFRSVSDMVVTQQYRFPRRARFGPSGIFRSNDIFTDFIGDYDPQFWENYNVIKPDEDLRNALKQNVDSTKNKNQ